MHYTPNQIIDRMNLLGGLTADQKDELRSECRNAEAHEPCGEYFCTTIPTHVCMICGDKFQIGDMVK